MIDVNETSALTSTDRSAAAGRRASGVLGCAVVAVGLIAGVFYAFACAVMVGLRGADDRTFIDVLQRINDKIENPVFFASFLGALVLPAIAIALLRRAGSRPAIRWTVAALALYGVAVVVTMAANVPLNQHLADAGDPARIADPAGVRHTFENSWIAWNVVRAVVSTAALGCLSRALLLHGRRRTAPGSLT